MARELHACSIRYFTRLEELNDKWKELSERAERPLQILSNRAEQFRLVSEEVEGLEESLGGEKRERLIFQILMSLEDELALLVDILVQFNDANQNLKNYLTNLENARSKVSLKDEAMKELINGTPHRPKLDLLLEWAVEGYQFYHNMYLRISDCMKHLDYKREETIDNLTSSFTEKKRERRNINRILTFTQFLSKETSR